MNLNVPFTLVKEADPLILNPMTSKIEKSILEYLVIQDDIDLVFDEVCRIFNIPDYLPLDLKIACIYKVREISFGPDLSLRYVCDNCKRLTESLIFLENLLIYPLEEQLPPDLKNLKLKETNIQKILNLGLAESFKCFERVSTPKNLPEASRYAFALKAKIPTIKKEIDCRCFFCGDIRKVNIINKKFIIDSLSEQTMLSMIKLYNALAMNGFTKSDVDSMLPFEREVHAKLFKERTESLMPPKKEK